MARSPILLKALAASLGLTLLAGCPVPGKPAEKLTWRNSSDTPGSAYTPGTLAVASTASVSDTSGSGAGGLTSSQTGGGPKGDPSPGAPLPASPASDNVAIAGAYTQESLQEEGYLDGYDASAEATEQSAGTPTSYALLQAAASPDTGANAAAAASAPPGAIASLAPLPTLVAPVVGLKAAPAPKARPAAHQGLSARQRETIVARHQAIRSRNLARLHGEDRVITLLLAAAHWTHAPADPTVLTKDFTGSVSHTSLQGKISERSLTLHREIKAQTHELVMGLAEVVESLPGGSNTLHWEKTLQPDGSYDVVFHHTRRWGTSLTRDAIWTKQVQVNGDMLGSAMVIWTDKSGTVTATETLKLSGSESTGTTLAPISSQGTTPSLPADPASPPANMPTSDVSPSRATPLPASHAPTG